jgi:hypothetical protein
LGALTRRLQMDFKAARVYMKKIVASIAVVGLLCAGARAEDPQRIKSVQETAFARAKSFPQKTSSHFHVYHESPLAPAGVMNVLESLHAKMLLDLIEFAPWASGETVDVVIYKNDVSYHDATGMPAWGGGHADMGNKAVFVFESDNFQRTMAHELTHLYFDDYFVKEGKHPPTWLNEGMATMMEWDYGWNQQEAQFPAAKVADRFMPLDRFFAFDYYDSGATGETVSLWYMQASSLVRYLFRRFPRSQFVSFCRSIKEGKSVDDSLKAAYSLQIPNAATFERLWRENLKNPQ